MKIPFTDNTTRCGVGDNRGFTDAVGRSDVTILWQETGQERFLWQIRSIPVVLSHKRRRLVSEINPCMRMHCICLTKFSSPEALIFQIYYFLICSFFTPRYLGNKSFNYSV